MFIILKMGDTFAETAARFGDFEDWTLWASGLSSDEALVVDPRSEEFPPLDGVQGIIITGSHDMVTHREPYVERTAEWLHEAAKAGIGVLGVCFGHQLIAQAFGGVVGDHPEGPEIGTVSISLTDEGREDRLLGALPETFLADVTHTQSVLKMPPDALLLAQNCYEPCEAFRVGQNIWGVQFHPEHTPDIIKDYILEQTDVLKDEPARVLADVCPTPYASSVIKRFVELSKAKI
jgi:GMP synthase (glutamine-hydrolysing)